ncbi:MAG: hypothetical protein LBV39_07190, partial [Bacteroidales bacterium]|nr:hypothetical protein [Bacteroidales bacterium]
RKSFRRRWCAFRWLILSKTPLPSFFGRQESCQVSAREGDQKAFVRSSICAFKKIFAVLVFLLLLPP